MKVETINYQGKDYATVPARLKEFRSKNPRASIETHPQFLDDGSLIFRAKIVQDRKDEYSATATGSAKYSAQEASKTKAFEKLETISVGRALSILGYLNDGNIASTEEMLEFEDYQEDKFLQAVETIKKAKTRAEIAKVQASLPPSSQAQLNPHILERVKELQHATAK